jgi:hypothetical protein
LLPSQSFRPLVANTNSTIANEMPKVGTKNPPPDLISSVDPGYAPKHSIPENIERMTGDTRKTATEGGTNKEIGVGELEGAKSKVEPLRRTGEDENTMRARLVCTSLLRICVNHPSQC